jgi:NAD(P)-dependent dehydrogenase (short-subunit alcohol dehydrogenase family)
MATTEGPLADRIAVVAGATRGSGRGTARMLGEQGATVYCTGRNSREARTDRGHYAGRPETIEETAELVSAAGGVGIPVRVDHANEAEVASFFRRVKKEHGRVDVLVNVLGGEVVMGFDKLWKIEYDAGRALFETWVWPHVITARHAAPLMAKGGLMVEMVEGHTLGGYRGHFYFDLILTCLKRLAYALAEELGPKGVTSIALTPGFMRTEGILDSFGATESNWREVARTNASARQFGFEGSETPAFVGRAIAAIAADPKRARWNGGVYGSWQMADEYGFTDVDGSRPHWWHYFSENFPQYVSAGPASGVRWEAVAAT